MIGFVWAVAAGLYAAGLAMLVLRRELIAMLLGVETMILAVNLVLVYTAVGLGDAAGVASALIVIGIAAAEAAVGLTLVLRLNRAGRPADAGTLAELKG